MDLEHFPYTWFMCQFQWQCKVFFQTFIFGLELRLDNYCCFRNFYKKCFPPRAKTSFCLSNQKPRVNILEPRHLIVNWAHFFSNVCSFYLFSDIIMELFILQFISSWLFKIDSWLILVIEWKYFYSTLIITWSQKKWIEKKKNKVSNLLNMFKGVMLWCIRRLAHKIE